MLNPFRRRSGASAFSAVTGFIGGLAQLIFVLGVIAAIFIAGAVGLAVAHFSQDLPDHQQLLSYQPATGTKVYAGDGSLLAEFSTENRIITPFKDIPPLVVHAFLAAEDRDFYSHNGVNPGSIARAALADIARWGHGQRPLGASTITQQLVRHFLLTNEVSVARKIKEALLAYRIESQLSKDRILEIYLNEIYLGAGTYGVAAAADVYFGKRLVDLTPAEAAFLSALPKAPNNYNPVHHRDAAVARRNWVLDGMAEEGWISAAEAQVGKTQKLDAVIRTPPEPPRDSGYFVEDVRRQLIERFGEKAVYEGGLTVRTSYIPIYQAMAEKAFRDGLVEYDRRHGWRGPAQRFPNAAAALSALSGLVDSTGMPSWKLAAVMSLDNQGATVRLKSGAGGRIPWDELRWARASRAQMVSAGDIVLVEPLDEHAAPSGGKGAAALPLYGLRQVPEVGGGFLAMDPKTGRVFALVGGWDYHDSQFDRATQAMRQPGSSIKPFVYITALQTGDYTPSSVIEDAPISLPQGPGMPMWTPANYEGNYVGQTTLFQALVHSRNLATARLASLIGMAPIAKTVTQFGIMDKMPLYYSMALGAGDTTLYRMVSAYAMLDNGGHWLNASMIDMVQDRDGRIIYQKGTAQCAACYVAAGTRLNPDSDPAYTISGKADPSLIWLKGASFAANPILYRPTKPDPLVDPVADSQIISMMQGVVQQGTGIKVAAVGKPLAGKTGTSSDWFDAWFVGFSPDLAAGAYVGFDTPRTLGDGETGGNVAAPIFRDFMADALKDQPAIPFPENSGGEMVMINSITGQPTVAGDKDATIVAYRPGSAPTAHSYNQYASHSVPSDQEASDAIDGGPVTAMPGGQIANAPMPYSVVPAGAMPNAPMMPVNSRIPAGTVLPPPRMGPGTGGLY